MIRELAGTLEPGGPVVELARRSQPGGIALLRRVLAAASTVARCVQSRWMPQALPFIVYFGVHYSGVVVRLERHPGAVDATVEVFDDHLSQDHLDTLGWFLQQAGVRTMRPPCIFETSKQVSLSGGAPASTLDRHSRSYHIESWLDGLGRFDPRRTPSIAARWPSFLSSLPPSSGSRTPPSRPGR